MIDRLQKNPLIAAILLIGGLWGGYEAIKAVGHWLTTPAPAFDLRLVNADFDAGLNAEPNSPGPYRANLSAILANYGNSPVTVRVVSATANLGKYVDDEPGGSLSDMTIAPGISIKVDAGSIAFELRTTNLHAGALTGK